MSEWTLVQNGENMADGTMITVSANGRRLIVYKTSAGYFASDRRCTHQGADLARGYFDDVTIECPVHQGRFNVCTGSALGAPVTVPLTIYPVKIIDGLVYVGVTGAPA